MSTWRRKAMECLPDYKPATREAMPQWITRQTYDHIRVLLERRLDEAILKEVDAGFGLKKNKR